MMIILISFIMVFIACCMCIDYFWPHQMQWYNSSYDMVSNVTIGMDIQTLGPEPVTIFELSIYKKKHT